MRCKHHNSRAGWLAGRRDCRLADGRCARLIQSTNNKLTCGAGRGAGWKSFVGFLYFIPLLLYTLRLDSRLFPNTTTVDILRPAPNSLSVVHHHPPIVHTFLFIYIYIMCTAIELSSLSYSFPVIVHLAERDTLINIRSYPHLYHYVVLLPLLLLLLPFYFYLFFSPSSRTVSIPNRNTFSRISFVILWYGFYRLK